MDTLITIMTGLTLGVVGFLIYLAALTYRKPKPNPPFRVGIPADMRVIPAILTIHMCEDLSIVRELTATEFLFLQMHYSEYSHSPLLNGDIVILRHLNPDKAERYLTLEDIIHMIEANKQYINHGVGNTVIS